MPTFNQLVRKGRAVAEKKSKAPALQKSMNTLKKETVDMSSPRREAYAQLFVLLPLRSLTLL